MLAPGLVKHLLLLNRWRNLRCLASEVEVLANRLLRGRAAAKGVVVEDVIRFVKLIAESIISVFEVDAGFVISAGCNGASNWRPTHHRPGPRPH
jgi:hypothetical protein